MMKIIKTAVTIAAQLDCFNWINISCIARSSALRNLINYSPRNQQVLSLNVQSY